MILSRYPIADDSLDDIIRLENPDIHISGFASPLGRNREDA